MNTKSRDSFGREDMIKFAELLKQSKYTWSEEKRKWACFNKNQLDYDYFTSSQLLDLFLKN